jgi:hypothetical protein
MQPLRISSDDANQHSSIFRWVVFAMEHSTSMHSKNWRLRRSYCPWRRNLTWNKTKNQSKTISDMSPSRTNEMSSSKNLRLNSQMSRVNHSTVLAHHPRRKNYTSSVRRDEGYRWAWSDTCCIDNTGEVEDGQRLHKSSWPRPVGLLSASAQLAFPSLPLPALVGCTVNVCKHNCAQGGSQCLNDERGPVQASTVTSPQSPGAGVRALLCPRNTLALSRCRTCRSRNTPYYLLREL